MNYQDIMPAVIVALAPGFSLLVSATSIFNLNKKETDQLFEDIRLYIQKVKVENIYKIIFPESIGINKENNQSDVNTDALKSISKDIDGIEELQEELSKVKRYSNFYYKSLFWLLFLGVVLIFINLFKLHLSFIEDNYVRHKHNRKNSRSYRRCLRRNNIDKRRKTKGKIW